ncbi:ABC transporter ATP-binding protein [Celerinatantimonas sp. YJH-8]|uniref:ABC transporter ATP-binding protein n=1 Tax=Celerinatantimonas sp. YJH-8 TaxID=3228714 RepID=UPI0038BF64D1
MMAISILAKAAPEEMLSARQVVFGYGAHPVLKGVSVSLKRGEILALLGANGCGKSTLLQLLLGLAKPQQGQVWLCGKPLADYSRKALSKLMAYVPQHHVCPFPYRVREVVAMGQFSQNGLFGHSSSEQRQQIEALLERFHIEHLANRPYTEISGGERQMVLLCRAILQGASLLILDEPASALDFGHQARLLSQLKELSLQGYSVVMTTHHPQHAQVVADRVVLMKQGEVLCQGHPSQVLSERQLATLYDLSLNELRLVTAPAMECQYG